MRLVADIVSSDGQDQETYGPTLPDREWAALMVHCTCQRRRRRHQNPTSIDKMQCSAKTCRRREACLCPPSRSVRVTLGRLEGPEPESPTLLLSSSIDSLLDMLDAGVISNCGVLVITIDIEIRGIRSNVVANLILRELWCPK